MIAKMLLDRQQIIFSCVIHKLNEQIQYSVYQTDFLLTFLHCGRLHVFTMIMTNSNPTWQLFFAKQQKLTQMNNYSNLSIA